MRRLIAFPCEGKTLIGSLDEAGGAAGLLIVSGGNEPRMGAHRGMALLAGRVAAQGWPVFRYDRRGVGDSGGENGGWATGGPDLAAAAAAFRRAAPQVTRLVGYGNCDAATTLALFGAAAGVEAVVLANPWVVERRPDGLPPPAAIRAHYAARARSPAAWLRLARGGVSSGKLLGGLRALVRRPDATIAARVAAALDGRDVTVVLARGDATAIAWRDAVRRSPVDATTVTVDTDSHSFARAGDMVPVERAILRALRLREREGGTTAPAPPSPRP